MEATTPAPSEPPRDPAPHEPVRDTSKAGALARVGAVILALVLAFITAVMVIAMLDINDTATCADVDAGIAQLNEDLECYGGSDSTKTIAVVLGLAGAALAGLATLWRSPSQFAVAAAVP